MPVAINEDLYWGIRISGISQDLLPILILYKEGTLVIDTIETGSKESVWKGLISEDIYGNGTIEAVTGMINVVFQEYPLKKF